MGTVGSWLFRTVVLLADRKEYSKMAWKHRAQAPRQYTTFLRDDETIRQNYLRLDDVTFKRLQLYERKMKGKTTEELLASVEKATKKKLGRPRDNEPGYVRIGGRQ